ncbi:MAG: YkgJ family cysteine cluster protein [Candidatus Woesearchaeota archaeon]
MDDLEILDTCVKCGAKCCKLGGSNFTTKERNAIINAGYPDHIIELSPNHWEFISKKGICPYLNKDNSCSIHEVRPLACRCFPVHPEINNGKKEYYLAQCPLGKKLQQKIILQMKKDASKYPSKIIKERLEKSNVSEEDFILIKKRLKDFKSIKI